MAPALNAINEKLRDDTARTPSRASGAGPHHPHGRNPLRIDGAAQGVLFKKKKKIKKKNRKSGPWRDQFAQTAAS